MDRSIVRVLVALTTVAIVTDAVAPHSDLDCDAALIPVEKRDGSEEIDFYVCITRGMSVIMPIVRVT